MVRPTRIHGIRRRTLRNAPALDGALAPFVGLLSSDPHRPQPRLRPSIPRRSATATGTELRHEGELCTLTLARRLDPERRYSHRLGDLCGRHGVPLERAHDALEDAVATARLLPHLFEEAGVETLGELETLLAPRHPNDPADDPTGPIPRPSS
ncbi:MAG: 3'-5' exonuclease [Ilumatobacteraceae bacterium]